MNTLKANQIIAASVGIDFLPAIDGLKKFETVINQLPAEIRKNLSTVLRGAGRSITEVMQADVIQAIELTERLAESKSRVKEAKRIQGMESRLQGMRQRIQNMVDRGADAIKYFETQEQLTSSRSRSSSGGSGGSTKSDYQRNQEAFINGRRTRAGLSGPSGSSPDMMGRLNDWQQGNASPPADPSTLAQKRWGLRAGHYKASGNEDALWLQYLLDQEAAASHRVETAKTEAKTAQDQKDHEGAKALQARRRLNAWRARSRSRQQAQREQDRKALEMEREQERKESERQRRWNSFTNWSSASVAASTSFMGGMVGGLISAAHLPGPFRSAATGAAGGMSVGMSVGMIGGPLGVIGGGILGAGAGGILGAITGVVDSAMGLLFSGVHRAMSVIERGAVAIIHLGMDYERQLTKFEILGGGAEKGRELHAGLERMAVQSPYKFSQLSAPTELLLGYGASSKTALGITQRLGDVAGGDPVRLERLALAAGQVMSQGRLMGQELRQFAEAGVGAEDFAKAYGKPVAQLRHDMELGIVPASVMVKTLQQLTSEGGRFFGMMDRTAKTTEGRWNALLGTLEMVGRRLGKGVLEKLDVSGVLGKGITSIQGLLDPTVIEKATDAIANFGKELWRAIKPTVDSVKDFGKDLWKVFGGESDFTWKEFSRILLSTFKEIERITLKIVTWLKEDAAPVLIGLAKLTAKGADYVVSPSKGEEAGGFWNRLGKRILWNTTGGPVRDLLAAYGTSLLTAGTGEADRRDPRDPTNRQDWMKALRIDEMKEESRLYAENAFNLMGSNKQEDIITRKRLFDKSREITWMIQTSLSNLPNNEDMVSLKQAPTLSMAGGAMGLAFDRGWTSKAKEREEISLTLKPSEELRKLFEDISKAMKEGLTPYDKYVKALKDIDRSSNMMAYGGDMSVGGAAAAAIGNVNMTLTPEQAKAARFRAYSDLTNGIDIQPNKLPGAAGRDTQEAIKIINEQVLQKQELTMDRIAKILDVSKAQAETYYKKMDVVADFYKANPNPVKMGIK